jgi:hypothetical protein
MQRTVRINLETYNKLNSLRNKLFPFQVSFPKIIKLATDQLDKGIINAKENQKSPTK